MADAFTVHLVGHNGRKEIDGDLVEEHVSNVHGGTKLFTRLLLYVTEQIS